MNQDVESRILDLLASKVGTRPDCSDRLAHLNIDSLALAEISAEIEKTFAVKLDERVLEVDTVGEMISYVADLRERQGAKPSRG